MKNTSKRFVSLLLVFVMMLGVAVFDVTASAAVTMTTKDGFLAFEAEELPYDKAVMETVKGDLFSAGKGIGIIDEDKTEPKPEDPAHLDLSFTADKAGTYNIWVRHTASVANMSGQNVFIALNGGNYTIRMLTAEPEEPKWVNLGSAKANAANEKVSVKIRRRQRLSIVLDYVVITSDASYIPDDAKLNIKTKAPVKTAAPTVKPTPGGKAAEFAAKGGYAMIEAEKMTIHSVWTDKTDSAYSGGKALNTAGDSQVLMPGAEEPGELEFNVKVDADGIYTLWVNAKPTTPNKTMNVSINGEAYKTCALGTPENAYAWRKLTATTASVQAGSTINFRLRTRNGYYDVDNFVLTNDRKAKPEGTDGKLVLNAAATLPDNLYPKPSFTPPPVHPRLYFMAEDIPSILENAQKSQNQAAWKKHEDNLTKDVDGKLKAPSSGASNMDNTALGIIESYAFDYVTRGNEALGKKAVEAMKNYLASVVFIDPNNDGYTRNAGHTLFTMAEVYDWCYPLLTAEDKLLFADETERIVSEGIEVGWPPTRQGSVTSHGSEAQILRDLLSVAVAMYDERPDIYNVVGGRFFADYLPARQYAYPSHMWHQGTGYGVYRGQWDYNSTWIFDRMGLPKVYGDDQQYMMYWYFYMRRPDGQILRDGDASTNGAEIGTYNTGLIRTMMLAANYYQDPYMKQEMMREAPFLTVFNVGHGNMSCVEFLIFNDPELSGKPVGELPLTKYFASPMGNMIARTGWNDGINAPDVVAQMKINEVWFANHHHQDAGHFQLYYKGLLAGDSGRYEGYGTAHDYNYNKRTIAHNTILVYDPNESITYINATNNDGGQLAIGNATERAHINFFKDNEDNHIGKVEGMEFGPDKNTPEYSYMKGDLTKAYSSNKMKDFDRSFMFLNLNDDEHPGALVVFDRVVSAKAEFKKTWLLHSPEEPVVSGNRTVVKNNINGYNGKMTVDTLLPKADNTAIEVIGGLGKEFWVSGQNYPGPTTLAPNKAHESDGWRIEVSPKKAETTNYFLNVLQVGDAEPDMAALPVTLIETDTVAGAQIADRVTVFSKSSGRTKDNVEFTVAGDGIFKITVAGINEGTWKVTKDGTETGTYSATAEGGLLPFEGEAGKYVVSYVNATVNRKDVTAPVESQSGIDIKLDRKFLYTDVKPQLVNDRTMVPLRAIFEAMQAEVDWNNATRTVTAKREATTVTLTIDDTKATVNGETVTLDTPAMIIDDRTMVPLRFVSESMGASVEWDPFAHTAIIYTNAAAKTSYPPLMKLPNALTVYKITQSGDDGEGNLIQQSLDGDLNTRWAVQGTKDDAWGIYDLGSVKTLDSVYLSFFNGNSRTYTFSIAVSEDGENYKTILSDIKTSGATSEMEKYDMKGTKARYVKYMGDGNSTNMWNSMTEIAFIEKK